MSQSALLNNILPKQLSFKHTLQLWLSWRQCGVRSCEENIVKLSTLIAQKKVANRPGRIEPRAVKRRPKPMPLLTKKREKLELKSLRVVIQQSLSKCHSGQSPFNARKINFWFSWHRIILGIDCIE
ncbi:MAG: hypothetical protein ACJATV_000224 [Granulosicoccus sp.]|jgi:hypothetical protein